MGFTQSVQRSAMRRVAVSAVAVCALACILPASAQAQANDLIVHYDQSQLIRLPRRATEVIIGNPSIADVSIQGGNLIVVTGKSFGTTNIIALDEQRNVIQDQRVIVNHDDRRSLVLYKGPQRETYTCSPTCTPTITIGDESGYFEDITKHTQRKFGVSGVVAGQDNAPAQQ